MRKLKIGLLGCGVVGGGFVELLQRNRDLIRERAQAEFELTRILIRDPTRERRGVPAHLLTTDADRVIGNGADVIVELIGGAEPARTHIRSALAAGKHVVTANKQILATGGNDLLGLAATHRVTLGFEASVCGAIPIVRTLRHATAGDRLRSLSGVVNGTSNFILCRMAEGMSWKSALTLAQQRGFAEADPALDISGEDAAFKLTILAQLAWPDRELKWKRREGISEVTPEDCAAARSRGAVLRHLVSARAGISGEVILDSGVVEISDEHAMARVRGEGNGIVLEAEAAGELTFYGAGAGSLPSASSVLSDVIAVARAM